MKKIVYIVFGINKALEFEWLISEIDTSRFELSFISIHPNEETHLKKHCENHQVPFYHIPYNSKKDILKSTLKIRKMLKKIDPDIVHSHIFEGGLIGITAAWLAGIKHRIYTRHYSDFHHVYHPNGLKYDQWINARSTHIVAVSEVVKDILIKKENVPKQKVSVIHHGIPQEEDNCFNYARISVIKEKYNIPDGKQLIGVVSRYTKLKGIQFIIPALKELFEENENLHLVLANAKGNDEVTIKKLLQKLPKDAYTEILFENDNEALFRSFDVFIHVPISREAEAFGLTYLEALNFDVPSVFTLSGIAHEMVKDEENALVVNYQNSDEIVEAVRKLLANEELRIKLSNNGKKSVETYTTRKKMRKLEELYENVRL